MYAIRSYYEYNWLSFLTIFPLNFVISELRALPSHDGRGQPGLRTQDAKNAEGCHRAARRASRPRLGSGRVPRSPTGRAIRRSAPKGGAGARNRAGASYNFV